MCGGYCTSINLSFILQACLYIYLVCVHMSRCVRHLNLPDFFFSYSPVAELTLNGLSREALTSVMICQRSAPTVAGRSVQLLLSASLA